MRERILVFGPAGAGKSRAWLSIARHFPSKQFYCIDSDDSIERMLMDEEFDGMTNVHVYNTTGWRESEQHLATIQGIIRPDDWIVADMLCSQWDFVQNFFVEQIFGKQKDEYFLEVRKTLKPGASKMETLKGWIDWNVINALYQDWINSICYRMKSNVFLAAKGVSLGDKDEKEVVDLLSHIGIKPEGEKRNMFRVHTVLMLRRDKDNWIMSTVKDRARRYVERLQVRDFALQYGMAIAKWEIEE
jgi:phage terminase small subunit